MTTSEKLVHYSNRQLREVHSCKQSIGMKPSGLWFSVEGQETYDWKEWCIDNEYRVNNLAFSTELEVVGDILRLSTAIEIDSFTNQFGDLNGGSLRYNIKWYEVAERYQGIIISPYCWERRLAQHLLFGIMDGIARAVVCGMQWL